MCPYVSNFERFSLTIARWLTHVYDEDNPAESSTNPGDVAFCPHLPPGQYVDHCRIPSLAPQECGVVAPCRGRATNHDFFSGSGSSYVIGKAVATEDDDWDF